MTSSVAVLCLAVVLCPAVSFFARTGEAIRGFLALRKEARSLLKLHWRARASSSPAAAINHYRKIGGELFAFDQSERPAAFLMRLAGYKPREAGIALITIANEWAEAPAGSPDDEYGIIELTLYPQHRRFKKWQAFF